MWVSNLSWVTHLQRGANFAKLASGPTWEYSPYQENVSSLLRVIDRTEMKAVGFYMDLAT